MVGAWRVSLHGDTEGEKGWCGQVVGEAEAGDRPDVAALLQSAACTRHHAG